MQQTIKTADNFADKGDVWNYVETMATSAVFLFCIFVPIKQQEVGSTSADQYFFWIKDPRCLRQMFLVCLNKSTHTCDSIIWQEKK